MLRIIIGGFFLLHGMVHLLYAGQALRFFELQPGLVWPDGAWAFSRLPGEQATRMLGAMACVLAAAGFVVSGTGLLVRQPWWRPLLGGVAAFSTVAFVLFWNGKLQRLPDQGWVAVLINGVILIVVFILHWPSLEL
jgi:hypothetical protein